MQVNGTWQMAGRAPPGAGGSARARRPGASQPQTSSPPGGAPERAQLSPSRLGGPQLLCSTWCRTPVQTEPLIRSARELLLGAELRDQRI